MSAPRSVRLSDDVAARLDRHVQRTGGSTSSVIERLLDEALRMAEHPLVFFQDGPAGRRPKLVGGPDVWEVVSALWDIRTERGADDRPASATVADLADTCGISEAAVRAAVSYYAQFTGEIDDWVRHNRDLAEETASAWAREQEVLTGRPA